MHLAFSYLIIDNHIWQSNWFRIQWANGDAFFFFLLPHSPFIIYIYIPYAYIYILYKSANKREFIEQLSRSLWQIDSMQSIANNHSSFACEYVVREPSPSKSTAAKDTIDRYASQSKRYFAGGFCAVYTKTIENAMYVNGKRNCDALTASWCECKVKSNQLQHQRPIVAVELRCFTFVFDFHYKCIYIYEDCWLVGWMNVDDDGRSCDIDNGKLAHANSTLQTRT